MQITFPYVGEINGSKVWRNAETGVEIVKGKNFKELGLYWVCEPKRDSLGGRQIVGAKKTLADVRSLAAAQAIEWRQIIADAYDEACWMLSSITSQAMSEAPGDTPEGAFTHYRNAIDAADAGDGSTAMRELRAARRLTLRHDPKVEQVLAWLERRGVGLTPTPGTVHRGVELDHADAIEENRYRVQRAGRALRRAPYPPSARNAIAERARRRAGAATARNRVTVDIEGVPCLLVPTASGSGFHFLLPGGRWQIEGRSDGSVILRSLWTADDLYRCDDVPAAIAKARAIGAIADY